MKALNKDLMSFYKDFNLISSVNSTKPDRKCSSKRAFSGLTITTISINVEGLTRQKETILAHLCNENKCDVLCIQETHRDRHHERPRIEGMCFVAEMSHSKHGSAVFARPEIAVKSTSYTEDGIEIISIKLDRYTITSIYKPPNQIFNFKKPKNFSSEETNIVVGDFNSRSINWGYIDTDESRESVERWASATNLMLLHDPKLSSSFQSGRWRRGCNPDNIFISEKD